MSPGSYRLEFNFMRWMAILLFSAVARNRIAGVSLVPRNGRDGFDWKVERVTLCR